MNHDVFLSYATSDDELARAFLEAVEMKGVRCWFAPRDNVHGEQYGLGIVRAIQSSSLFVVLLSRASDSSLHVKGEIVQAIKQRIPILVFRVEEFTLSPELSLYLDSIHWFTGAIEEFAEVVSKRLQERRVRELDPRVPPEPLYGRADDLEKIIDKLSRGSLAVIGIEGIGKSKVVSAAFERLAAEGLFPFRALFWKRFSVDDPPMFAAFARSVVQELTGDRMDFDQLSLAEQVDAVVEALKGRDVLLVVDQFEAVVDGQTQTPQDAGFALFLSHLMDNGLGNARVLLTSWEAPKDEKGMCIPFYTLEGISVEAGLDLFRRAGADPMPTSSEKLFVEVIRRMGGHPYAIELLARNCSESEVRQMLADEELWRKEFSTISGRIVSKVYGRLDAEARGVLTAVCILLKPESRQTIERLAGVDSALPALRTLRQHAVVIETGDSEYEVHGIVRDYVLRQITAEERARLHLRAAGLYQQKPVPPDDERTGLADVMPLLDALDHLIAAEEAEIAAALLLDSGLRSDLYWWGYRAMLAGISRRILDLGVSPDRTIELNIQLGKIERDMGRLSEARAVYEGVLPVVARAESRRSEIALLVALGDICHYQGEYSHSAEYHRRADELLASFPDAELESENTGDLANAVMSMGDYDEAMRLYQRAIELSRQGGIRRYEGIWNGGLANLYRGLYRHSRDADNKEKALFHYAEAIDIAAETGDRRHVSHWSGVAGEFYRILGDLDTAHEHLRQALMVAVEIGYFRGMSAQVDWLSSVYVDRIRRHLEVSDVQGAFSVAKEFTRLAEEVGVAELRSNAESLGEQLRLYDFDLLLGEGRVEQALTRGKQLLGDGGQSIDFCSALGSSCMRWGRSIGSNEVYTLGVDAYTKAIELAPAAQLGKCYESRAGANALLGRVDDAIADYDEALSLGIRKPGVALSRAEVLMWAGRYDEALSGLQDVYLNLECQADQVLGAWLMCHVLNFLGRDYAIYRDHLADSLDEHMELAYGVRDIEPYIERLDRNRFSETQIENAWDIQRLIREIGGSPSEG